MSVMSILLRKICCCFLSVDDTDLLHSCPSINPSAGHRLLCQTLSHSSACADAFAILSLSTPSSSTTPTTPSSLECRHLGRQRFSSSTGAAVGGSISRCSSSQPHGLRQRSKTGYTVVEDGDCPELKCVVIPSFGKCPPHVVAVKKKNREENEKAALSDFLGGVGDDLERIQTMIGADSKKGLVRVELMCHFKQVKMREFERIIKSRMEDIKLSREGSSAQQNGRKYKIICCVAGNRLFRGRKLL